MIRFVRTFDHELPMPSRGSELAAGLDLCAAEDVTIYAGQRYPVSTGWAWDTSDSGADGTIYGRIAPRSGLALRQGVDIMAGVVDADYQGEIKVLVVNLDERPLKIEKGMRIAQMVIEQHFSGVEIEEGTPESMGYSERGQDGFGSTGV